MTNTREPGPLLPERAGTAGPVPLVAGGDTHGRHLAARAR